MSREMMSRVASAWTGRPASEARVEVIDVDQWTVQESCRGQRPLWKYSWPNGEQVYVSEASGEVVQFTTSASRLGAWLGPIPHWLYFTPLRGNNRVEPHRHLDLRDRDARAMLGLVVGMWMYSPSKRYRYAGVPTGFPIEGRSAGIWCSVCSSEWAPSRGHLAGCCRWTRFRSPVAARADATSFAPMLRDRLDLAPFEASIRAQRWNCWRAGVKELEFASFAGSLSIWRRSRAERRAWCRWSRAAIRSRAGGASTSMTKAAAPAVWRRFAASIGTIGITSIGGGASRCR